jgi:ubiquinone/menaquinone biosynthesis C-methylase UbiE
MVGLSGRTVGLDFDPIMIEMAKSLAPDIEWQQGDLQSLPFADGLFDLVMCQQGLQFVPKRDVALQQIYRVLPPDGRMVLGIWTELAKSPGQAALFGALGALLGTDMSQPPAWSLADGQQVMKLLSATGFVEVDTTVTSLQATFPSARQFVEVLIEGSSKLTRQALAQVPADRKAAFIDDVVARLHRYETGGELKVPMESRLVVARKR